MRLPTASYRHGHSCDLRGSNAGVSSHFLLPIPRWEVKTCHYAHHIAHCFATDHPRGRMRQSPYPTISGIRPYPPILDPALTRPRPSLDPPPVSREERTTWHRTQGLFPDVTTVSGDGQPFLRHVATAISTGLYKGRRSFISRHPGVLASSYPIKRKARAL
jgi:hypothetical protein